MKADATKYNIAQQALMAHLSECLTDDEYKIADSLIEEMARETHGFQAKANRPALEANRGVLRFEINKTGDMCLLDLQDRHWILPGYSRGDIIKMAQSLGMPAEFVEDSDV